MVSIETPTAGSNPTPKDSSERRGHLWSAVCLTILFALAIGFLWQIVFLDHVLMPLDLHQQMEPWRSELSHASDDPPRNRMASDALWQFYPMASYAQEAWDQGPPFWDPYVLSGMPALARGELFTNPVFVLLSSFLSIDRALNLNALFTLLIGSMSMFLLLREMKIGHLGAVVGSLAFTYNSYLIGWLSLPVTTASMVWLPLILWSYERSVRRRQWRWTLVGIIAFSLQILSGHILWPFYGAFTFCLMVALRTLQIPLSGNKPRSWLRSLVPAGIILGGAAVLTAPHVFQTLELFSLTGRSHAMGATSSLPLKNLIRLVAPDFWGNPLSGNLYWGKFNYTETALYFGVFPLILLLVSLFSPRKILARGIFGIGLVTLLAVYGVPPFRQVVAIICPVFLKTFPGRIFYVTAFAWAISAAIGADWLEAQVSARMTRRLSIGAGGLAAILLLFALTLVIITPTAVDPSTQLSINTLKVEHVRVLSLLTGAFWLAVSGLLLWFWRRPAARPMLRAGIIVVVMADLLLIGIRYNPSFPKDLAYPSTPSIDFLQNLKQEESEPFRILDVRSDLMLPGLAPQFFRLQTVSGYSSWLLKRYSDYAEMTGCRARGLHLQVYFKDCCNPLLDALNVKYILADSATVLRGTGTLDFLGELSNAHITSKTPKAIQRRTWNINRLRRKVLLQLPPSRIEFRELKPSRTSRLKTAIAMGPNSWNRKGDGVVFQIWADAGEPELLFSRYIDPKNIPSDRRWFPVDLDLGRFSGQETSISFITESGPDGNSAFDWAGWAEPRLTEATTPTLSLIFDGKNKIYRNNTALPRAWIVHDVTEVPPGETETVRAFLSRPDFDPTAEAVVEGVLPQITGTAPGLLPESFVQITSYEAQRIVIRSRTQADGLLILSDTYYPGWEATVDGDERAILQTNLIMRGLFLEAGEHEIIFEFHSSPFGWGVVFSMTTMGLAAIVMAVFGLGRVRRYSRARERGDSGYST